MLNTTGSLTRWDFSQSIETLRIKIRQNCLPKTQRKIESLIEKIEKDKEKESPQLFVDQMFIEQLGNRHLLAGIFQKQGLLVQEDFGSERGLSARSFTIGGKRHSLPPVNKDGMQPGESRRHWLLQFEFNDKGKWLAAL